MIQAIRQNVQVQADGRIEILTSELQAGTDAEVIVLVNDSPSSNRQFERTSEEWEAAIAKVQAIVRRHIPDDHSLVDELIRERRAESERE